MDEYAGGTHRSSYAGHTCNPYATDRNSGSSSTGSAAAPSANLAVCGISEESLGSIREPGKKSGLVAIAPTRGLVSRHGSLSDTQRRLSCSVPSARRRPCSEAP